MVFGSNLYTLMRSTNAETVALQRYWKDFYNNCVLGDIRINRKYTLDEFINAKDLLGFLASRSMSRYEDFTTLMATTKPAHKHCLT
ncbi:conjugal transfer protein TraG N-terminal domain-containing protein [Vibrio parahaemolyticus]|uniref:conjugal transfer protein TraG N-terminal domain-containing protein n=1 Tax=Vibrio parahaemolyticus TaxID=670 RepID=UPI00235A2148|nr:conjugal transfer protein TraG N-terminal domain-containing protein [Vibrio parahaemolyticus]